MSKTLVVGASSGLGRYLAEYWHCYTLRRGEPPPRFHFNTIVYCAARASQRTQFHVLSDLIEDNFLNLLRCVDISHDQFVFISSIDVYPKEGVRDPMMNLHIEDLHGGYPAMKLMSESVVLERCRNPIVLRPSTLLGHGMKENTLFRIHQGTLRDTTLSPYSSFNCVTYTMIRKLIEALEGSRCETLNATSCGSIDLLSLTRTLNQQIRFGDHLYHCGNLLNHRTIELVPDFGQSTTQILHDFFT